MSPGSLKNVGRIRPWKSAAPVARAILVSAYSSRKSARPYERGSAGNSAGVGWMRSR
jgi:hypothetical protein